MAMDIKDLKEIVKELSVEELENMSIYILEIIMGKQNNHTSNEDEVICPNCGSIHCVKNGMVRGKQRLLCRDCEKTFGYTSKSAISNTKLSDRKWEEYIKCMIQGFSIRKCAEIVGVGVKTSFYMRHKILDALNEFMDRENISGTAEMDETFLAESFKGNHKKSGFNMPRASHKRGKQVKKRGISKEQICIGTAIDKNGNIIMEMTCKGRITSKKLERLYKGHVIEGTTICTDSLSSYKTLSKKLKLNHHQIPTGEHSNGGFNLSSINSLHSKFKKWMQRFNGVSTKFLPNYLTWFKWLEKSKDIKESTKSEKMWNDAMSKEVDVRIDVLRQREPVWI